MPRCPGRLRAPPTRTADEAVATAGQAEVARTVAGNVAAEVAGRGEVRRERGAAGRARGRGEGRSPADEAAAGDVATDNAAVAGGGRRDRAPQTILH